MFLTSGSTCEKPFVPVNADFSCAKTEEGMNCTLICRQGYSLAQDAVHSYFCANNGIWEPPRSPDRPDCSREYCFSVTQRLSFIFALLFIISSFHNTDSYTHCLTLCTNKSLDFYAFLWVYCKHFALCISCVQWTELQTMALSPLRCCLKHPAVMILTC